MGGGFELICDQCNSRLEIDDKWGAAVDEWYSESGSSILTCPICQHAQPVTEWQYDPPAALGALGFTFWNWGYFYSSFIEEIGRLLNHRVIVVSGEI